MASILRSSKFVRYIAGFARNIVVNTPREFDGNFVNTTQCLCGAIPRAFATEASVHHDQGLERRIRSLDQDVRRSGRISRRDIEDVLEELRNSRSPTSSQSLLVIRCCGNLVPEELPETRTKLVEEIWNTLKRLNVPMDISHYNALLRVYLENEHKFSPTDFLADLETKGIEPNRVTYQRLIARYCQDGDIEGATRILEFMREKQLPVNENVFNALINGHSQAGDMDSAQGILSVMTQAGLEPSADTYTTLLCGYATAGNIDTIRTIMKECEDKEIYLLDKDLLDIVYSLAVNGHAEHVPEILSKTKKGMSYNQDCVNVILRLINYGQEESAFLILQTMVRITLEDGSLQPTGMFFIKQLVKAKRPLDVILKYCTTLKETGMYERSLNLAAEASLQLGYDELAYQLLVELNKEGFPIRQHYFWPLLKAKANDPTGDGIIEVLSHMKDFNLTPNAETIRDYVLPNIEGKSSEIISKLREANISVGAAASSLVYNLLQKNEIKEAALIATRVPAFYFPEQIRKPLTNAYYKTKDLESYITIVRSVYENLNRQEAIIGENGVPVDKSEVASKFLLQLATSSRMFSNNAEEILHAFVEQGLGISTLCAEKIQDIIGEKLNDNIGMLLGKLSSGELTPVPVEKQKPMYTPANQMNIPQLERLIHNLDSKNQETRHYRRLLLNLLYRNKDLVKMENVLDDLKKSPDFILSVTLCSQFFDIYCYHDKLDKALEMKRTMNEIDPDHIMDESRAVRLALTYTRNNHFDEAMEIIGKPNTYKRVEVRTIMHNTLCWQLLNHLAEQKDNEKLEQAFTSMVENGYVVVNNVILGPLIKVHILRGDLETAMEKFEMYCNQYKVTPYKGELASKLIEAEDAEKLQKLTDLSTTVHGEINSLYDLVFSFVECGRIRQARKILETPGLQSRPKRISSVCQKYQIDGEVKSLEGLKDATKDLTYIDRTDIYHQLLLSYIKQDDPDKALGLWTQMQEEDIAPTDAFLTKLGKYLKNRNIDVPFQIPEEISPSEGSIKILKRPNYEPPKPEAPQRSNVLGFRQQLKNGNVDAALDIKNKAKEAFPSTDLSVLVEKLVQANRLKEASDITFEILNRKSVPVVRVFRYLLNKLATAGDVETIEKIGSCIDSEIKKNVSYDNRLCHANVVSGKCAEYLDKLEKELEQATDDEVVVIGEKFPRGGAVGILERHPELLPKYEELALKYGQRGVVGPLNVLWAHYFINGQLENAEKIWNSHLRDAPRIMFQRVVQHAREQKDETVIQNLIGHLKSSKVTEGALGNAYSCLLDVLVVKEKNDEVVSTFEKAIKDVNIDFINRTAILRVKDVYTGLGKEFNHKIPAKNVKKDANSSDDDK